MSLWWQFEAKPFPTTGNYTNRVVHVVKAFLQSFVCITLSHIFGHVLMVNSLCYGRCSVKKLLPLCSFLKFHTHLEEISTIISKCLWQVFKSLKSCIFHEHDVHFSYFRVCCSLKKEIPISVFDVSFIPCSLLNSWGRCLQTRTKNRTINGHNKSL